MEDERVSLIMQDKKAYRPVFPLKGKKDKIPEDWEVVGFDTEYNDSENFYTYQLWHSDEQNSFLTPPGKLELEEIVEEAHIISGGNKILIASYFNMAELHTFATDFWKTKYEYYQVHPKSMFHIKGTYNGIQFLFYDLWHFFASGGSSGLKQVAKDFGYEKLDYDTTTVHRENLSDPKFKQYAMVDAKLCKQIFLDMERSANEHFNVSMFIRGTGASLAMASYQLNYLKRELPPPDNKIRRLALKCNWAARVEAGYVGHQDTMYEHDAEAFYPNSVLQFDGFPISTDWKDGIPDDFQGEGFATIEFEYPKDEDWPSLPVWGGDSLLFPLSGITNCTLGEIRLAITRGMKIKTFYSGYYYTKGSENSFITFMRDAVELKNIAKYTKNKSQEIMAKLMCNSVIGKQIQNRGGMNWEKFNKWAETIDDSQMIEDVLAGKLEGGPIPNFKDALHIGGTFLPEWHTLILGKSREIIARTIYGTPLYPQIYDVSTDALIIPNDYIGPNTKIPFKIKHAKVQGRIIRGKQYVFHNDTEILKCAHHAMHMSQFEAGYRILFADHHAKEAYTTNRFGTLKEATTHTGSYGIMRERAMSIQYRPEPKRRIAGDGYTHPWQTMSDYQNLRANYK